MKTTTKPLSIVGLFAISGLFGCSGDPAGEDGSADAVLGPDAGADAPADVAADAPADKAGPDAKTCTAAGDCPTGFCVDGVCCSSKCGETCYACNLPGSASTCAPVMGGEDKDTCSGTNACNSTGACRANAGVPCKTESECASGFCVDGVCCNARCDTACKSCNQAGKFGMCVAVLNQNDFDHCVEGNTCDGTGACKKVAGQACTAPAECVTGFCADGVCCKAACTEACRQCNDAAAPGTCSSVGSGTDPDTCMGANTCDAGVCKRVDGQPCSTSAECLSGSCVDGVCCDGACDGPCLACNLTGSVGACAAVTLKDDADTCTGTNSCDITGACRKKTGQPCTGGDTDCVSGVCDDGFCCGTRCPSCFQCSGAGTQGSCTPSPIKTYDCGTGAQQCDGAGACKATDGYDCKVNSDCALGVCTVYSPDLDGDTYGNTDYTEPQAKRKCGTFPLAGFGIPTDCCDVNAMVHPDAPNFVPGPTDFHLGPIQGICEWLGYDWNCDGNEELRFKTLASCFWTEFGCRGEGWAYSPTPGCGSSGQWGDCVGAGGMTCKVSPSIDAISQTCR